MRAKLDRRGAGQAVVEAMVDTDEIDDALEHRDISVIMDSGLERAEVKLMTDGRRDAARNFSILGKGNSSVVHLFMPKR